MPADLSIAAKYSANNVADAYRQVLAAELEALHPTEKKGGEGDEDEDMQPEDDATTTLHERMQRQLDQTEELMNMFSTQQKVQCQFCGGNHLSKACSAQHLSGTGPCVYCGPNAPMHTFEDCWIRPGATARRPANHKRPGRADRGNKYKSRKRTANAMELTVLDEAAESGAAASEAGDP